MRPKHRKSFVERGEIRLEIYTTRSNLYPEWWEFRKRFLFWRLRQRVRSNRKQLSFETQFALSLAEEALERELFYGRRDFHE